MIEAPVIYEPITEEDRLYEEVGYPPWARDEWLQEQLNLPPAERAPQYPRLKQLRLQRARREQRERLIEIENQYTEDRSYRRLRDHGRFSINPRDKSPEATKALQRELQKRIEQTRQRAFRRRNDIPEPDSDVEEIAAFYPADPLHKARKVITHDNDDDEPSPHLLRPPIPLRLPIPPAVQAADEAQIRADDHIAAAQRDQREAQREPNPAVRDALYDAAALHQEAAALEIEAAAEEVLQLAQDRAWQPPDHMPVIPPALTEPGERRTITHSASADDIRRGDNATVPDNCRQQWLIYNKGTKSKHPLHQVFKQIKQAIEWKREFADWPTFARLTVNALYTPSGPEWHRLKLKWCKYLAPRLHSTSHTGY
jgi:hypothetical protein